MKYSIIVICAAFILLYLYEKRREHSDGKRTDENTHTQALNALDASVFVQNAKSWQLHRKKEDAIRSFAQLEEPRLIVTEPSGLFFTVTGPDLVMHASDAANLRAFVSTRHHMPLVTGVLK